MLEESSIRFESPLANKPRNSSKGVALSLEHSGDRLLTMNSRRLDSRFLPLVLNVVDHGIFTVDPDGLITSFNRAAESITGYSEADVIGRPCQQIFRSEICETSCPLKRSIVSRRRTQSREVRIATCDNRVITISVSTAPLETRSGKLLGGVEVFHDLSGLQQLRRRLDASYRFDDIISKNVEMQKVFTVLPLASESSSSVLINGPSGTGKELVAKAIHNHGPRKNGPFVPVNCAALPESLLESELFGYKRGAFTDAKRDRPGRIAQAEGGTLFIDEVADIPRSLQVKLLRFLQERKYEPLGSAEQVVADVRIIAATNQKLEPMVANGSFRDDLYYRLNVLQINLPPLCERSEDIPLLVRHFIDRFRLTTGKQIESITEDAQAALIAYDYPGNVRELENLIERAFILCKGPQLSTAELPAHVVAHTNPDSTSSPRGELDHQEVKVIRQALQKHGNNRTRAAAELGIHRSTLLRKLKRYGLCSISSF